MIIFDTFGLGGLLGSGWLGSLYSGCQQQHLYQQQQANNNYDPGEIRREDLSARASGFVIDGEYEIIKEIQRLEHDK